MFYLIESQPITKWLCQKGAGIQLKNLELSRLHEPSSVARLCPAYESH